ncbi:signal peptidase II [Candidatus Pelagibacter sp. HIMB1509]|uniref:signal peptidase II n=1 Tax=Candidatus Pelagibacter sp. HIMB1509 TaxID=3413339 RepID=UPI003F853452
MILKKLGNFFFINLFLVSLIFLIDRLSKIYVIYLNNKSFENDIFISKFLNITLVWNQGIAFGLFALRENLYNILTSIIFLIILIIVYILFKSKGFKRYSLIFILGGATGNLFDRIYYKAVPDFIDFHVGEFHWFIFNVADIFITVGIIFMIFIEIIENQNSKIYEK